MGEKMRKFKTTADIPVPKKLIDQVIGQGKAVALVKKAAAQRRNVLMLGSPGTGKSMLAQGMAELMPATEMEDVLIYPNPNDENRPLVRVVKTYPSQSEIKGDAFLSALYAGMGMALGRLASLKNTTLAAVGKPKSEAEKFEEKMVGQTTMEGAGQGRLITQSSRQKPQVRGASGGMLLLFIAMSLIIFLYTAGAFQNEAVSSTVNTALSGDNRWFLLAIAGMVVLFYLANKFTATVGRRMGAFETNEPKLILDNSGKREAPFVDATGTKAGALLGDVKHDPLQSGGLGTPPHLRVEGGAVHRANHGVLFIDEVASLKARSQQELLTAMQEKKYPITGQSEMSSGALVKTEPVPCDFVLVAAGNVMDVRGMHPALRSRIRGNGYEVYMEDTMLDTEENRDRVVQFVAQEVQKDQKIPHFDREAVEEIISEAKRKAGRKKRLTLNLRELGGLVRAAGDIAAEEKAQVVEASHVRKAMVVAQTLEQQMSTRYIETRKDYRVFETEGFAVGKVNGLAVLGEGGGSGLVMPIVAEVTPASSKTEGKLIATGKLGKIAQEAVENVSAIIKKHIGRDVSEYDVHIQFLQTYEGVEGDSASVSIALAMLSAMEGIPIDQNIAMTGSLSVRGEVLPIGGATAKCEAAIEAGMKKILLPRANADDVYLPANLRKKIEIVPVEDIVDILRHALKNGREKEALIKKIKHLDINADRKPVLGGKHAERKRRFGAKGKKR